MKTLFKPEVIMYVLFIVISMSLINCTSDKGEEQLITNSSKTDDQLLDDFFKKNRGFDNYKVTFVSKERKKDFVNYLRGELTITDLREKYSLTQEYFSISDEEFKDFISGNLEWNDLKEKDRQFIVEKMQNSAKKSNLTPSSDSFLVYEGKKTVDEHSEFFTDPNYNSADLYSSNDLGSLELYFNIRGNLLLIHEKISFFVPVDTSGRGSSSVQAEWPTILLDEKEFTGLPSYSEKVVYSSYWRNYLYTNKIMNYNYSMLVVSPGIDKRQKFIKYVPFGQSNIYKAVYSLELWFQFFTHKVKYRTNFYVK